MNPMQGAIDTWAGVAQMYQNMAESASDPSLSEVYKNQVGIYNDLISQHGGTPVSFAPLSQPAPTPTPAPAPTPAPTPAPAPLASVAPQPAAPVQSPLQAVSQPTLDPTTLNFQNLANDFQRKANDFTASKALREAMQLNADIYKDLASQGGASSFEQAIDFGPQLSVGAANIIQSYIDIARSNEQRSKDESLDPLVRESFGSTSKLYEDEIRKIYESEGFPAPADIFSKPSSSAAIPEPIKNEIQQAAKIVYGKELSPEQLQRYAKDVATGVINPATLVGNMAYNAETVEEKARANTLLGYNYHELDPVEQMRAQLWEQYSYLHNQGGYSYKYGSQENLDRIYTDYAQRLKNAGIENIYDVKLEQEVRDVPNTRVIKTYTGGDFEPPTPIYYKIQTNENGEGVYVPLNEFELANLKVENVVDPEGGTYQRLSTTSQVTDQFLVNSKTGEKLGHYSLQPDNTAYFGAIGERKGVAHLNMQFTPDGVPLYYPVYDKKRSFLEQAAPFLAILAMPYAPQVGAALLPSAAAATQVAVGAAVINAGTQLATTGNVDVGQLALSAGVAYVGANAGLTGADIANDAAQLAAQGLDASQIRQVIAATGVNQATASVAANLAVAGVPASMAPAITSATINMGVSGLHAAVTGRDVEQAMINGALTGAGGEISAKVIDDILGVDNINAIARETGLLPNQVRAIGVNSLSNAISAEATGSGDFLQTFGSDLIANGMSFSAANKMSGQISEKVDPKVRAAIVNATRETTEIATRAAINGEDINDTLKMAMPYIAAKSISVGIQTPSAPAQKEPLQTGDKPAQQPPAQPVPDTKSPSVSGIPDGSGFKTPEEAMQWAKSLGESKVTWDGKVYEETSAKTVTGIPDGAGFKTPEEAIKWANSLGENKVVWNGQIYQNQTLSQTWQAIESSKTFSEAYEKARAALGPGAIFDWNGKKYTTDTREENKALAEASDRIRNIEQGVGGPKGTYAGYDEKEMANLLAMIDDNAINKAVSLPSGEVDFITDAITGKQTPVYGDKISKDLMAPVVSTIGVAVRGAGSVVDFTSGFLQSVEAIDKDSPMIKLAKDLKEVGEFQMGSHLLNEEKEFVKKVYEAEGVVDKGVALAKAIVQHPSALLTLSANEAFEELPSVLAMFMTGGVAGAARILALGTGGIVNYMEGAGANYNETKAKALAAGMSEQDAHRQAQKSAAAAGATQAVLGTFAEAPLVKKSFGNQGTLGTAVKREVVTEIPEEFAQTGFTDYFGTGAFDMNNALTSAVIAPVIAGTAVASIGTAISVARSGDATTEVLSTVAPENASAALGQIDSALQTSASIQEASQKIIPSLESLGFNPEQSVSIANTVATEQFLANINASLPADSKFSVDTVNVLIGASANGNPITLGDYIGATLTDRGEQMFVSPDLVIGTKNDGSLLTVADISGQITSLNPKTGQETQTSSQTDPATGATTTTKVSDNPSAGTSTETTTETDPSTNTNSTSTVTTTPDTTSSTDTVVNSNTNTQVDVDSKVDTNTNTTTTTAITTNTNTNTSVAIDLDSLISSLVAGGMSPIEAMKVATEEVKNAAKRGTLRARSGAGGFGLPTFSGYDESDFEHPSLFTRGPRAEFESPLEAFLRRMEPEAPTAEEKPMPQNEYFRYGTPSDIDEILSQNTGVLPTDVIPTGIGTSFRMPSVFGGMKAGGLVPAFEAGGLTGPLTIAAGKVRRDYREGDAVEGPGDGQSDDIPAMLADGEFVIPADVVAALGNGSNKAGADKLYEMMHNIRRDYRKAKPKDLPKPAKSPLQYIRRSK